MENLSEGEVMEDKTVEYLLEIATMFENMAPANLTDRPEGMHPVQISATLCRDIAWKLKAEVERASQSGGPIVKVTQFKRVFHFFGLKLKSPVVQYVIRNPKGAASKMPEYSIVATWSRYISEWHMSPEGHYNQPISHHLYRQLRWGLVDLGPQ